MDTAARGEPGFASVGSVYYPALVAVFTALVIISNVVENGVAIGWHRQPWILGCAANWDSELRRLHYENLRRVDGRIVFAGDHLSDLVAWQEGALTSSLDAVTRLHQRAVAA